MKRSDSEPRVLERRASPDTRSLDVGPHWLSSGLTSAEVVARTSVDGRLPPTGQSLGQILRRNAFTRLNFLLLILGTATLITGSGPDATFLVIAVINTVVGAVQELRAKRTLDALAVINAPGSRVIRDGTTQTVEPGAVVVDDLLDLRAGDQVTADAVVVADSAEMDESLITGESDAVVKNVGSEVMSGSWVVAGSVLARVIRTGGDSYASRLAEEARRFSLTSSELMAGINLVLKWLTLVMVVIAPVLFLRQLQSQPWRLAVRGAVAGLVGMIPEGLVLLTTLAFLAAALRLGKRRVLVQELPAVETLARVDSLCADKTGTLTEGGIRFSSLRAGPDERPEVEAALGALAGLRGANRTMEAIGREVKAVEGWDAVAQVPFSSARKWSGATFAGHGTWVVGAPEVISGADPDGLRRLAALRADAGARVLVVAHGPGHLSDAALPPDLVLAALIELQETPRDAVSATLRYFAEQQVTVRVISGDNPATVRFLAEQVGLPGADRAFDARGRSETDLDQTLEEGRVFGRVTPEQKRSMVAALQDHGHTVAMTGDGVNDVLALKQADLGIAMGSGSAITRGVAQVVLLDDDFDVLPSVVGEGRRVLTNIEVVACLFLVKNVYSLLLSVTTSITGWPYPFLPRHLTLISAVGIGIPGFFLALSPNQRRFAPGFLRRVLAFAVPAGALTTLAVIVAYALAREQGLSGGASRTAAIIVTVIVTLWVLLIAARPLTLGRVGLVAGMAGLFVAAYLTPGVYSFFSLNHRPTDAVLLEAVAVGVVVGAAIDGLSHVRLTPWSDPEPTQDRSSAQAGGR